MLSGRPFSVFLRQQDAGRSLGSRGCAGKRSGLPCRGRLARERDRPRPFAFRAGCRCPWQASLQPTDVLFETFFYRRERMGETIPFGDQHLDELAAARQERVERPESLVGKRPDGRAHSLGKQGQDVRVDAVRLGQFSHGPGKSANLARVGHDHGKPCGSQRGDGGGFVSAGSLQNDEFRARGLKMLQNVPNAALIIGDRQEFTRLGPRATTSSALATSMPTNRGEALIVRPPVRRVSRPCPALQDAGWLPGQLFGLVNEGRMAPQLTHGLEDHRQIELPSAVIRLHGARGGD